MGKVPHLEADSLTFRSSHGYFQLRDLWQIPLSPSFSFWIIEPEKQFPPRRIVVKSNDCDSRPSGHHACRKPGFTGRDLCGLVLYFSRVVTSLVRILIFVTKYQLYLVFIWSPKFMKPLNQESRICTLQTLPRECNLKPSPLQGSKSRRRRRVVGGQ